MQRAGIISALYNDDAGIAQAARMLLHEAVGQLHSE